MPTYSMPRPRFTADDLDDEQQRRKIISWLIQLDEQLRYLMGNLDEENMSQEFTGYIEQQASAFSFTAEDKAGLADAMAQLQILPGQITAIAQLAAGPASALQTQYSEVVITATQTKITTPEFIIRILRSGSAVTSLLIDKDGATMDYLAVTKNLVAPNMAEKFVGPNGQKDTAETFIVLHGFSEYGGYDTLQAAFDALNDRVLTHDVTVRLAEDVNEVAELRGVTGSGKITISGYAYNDNTETSYRRVLTGKLIIKSCSAMIQIEDLDIVNGISGNENAVELWNDQFVYIKDSSINGSSKKTGLYIMNGTKCCMLNVTLSYAQRLIAVGQCCDLHAKNLSGEALTDMYFLNAFGGRVTWEGTRPSGSCVVGEASLMEPSETDILNLTTAAGTVANANGIVRNDLSASLTATWNGSSWMSDNTLRMGIKGNENYMGVMWFDTRNVPSNAYVNHACLTLSRYSDVGRVVVNPTLQPTSASGPSGEPQLISNQTVGPYPLGAIQPGERKRWLIPTSFINAGGYTALAIYSGDTDTMEGFDFSENLASYGGTDVTGNNPVLTVTWS